jgi:hypothetical protein
MKKRTHFSEISTIGCDWVFLNPGEFNRTEFPPVTRIPYPINRGNAVGHLFGIQCQHLSESRPRTDSGPVAVPC